jgi:membrane protein involved in colicin uptake
MRDKTISFLFALIIHALLLVLIVFFSTERREQPRILPAPENLMQAVAVDESQLRAAATLARKKLKERQEAEAAELEKLERQKAEQERLKQQAEALKIIN